MKPPKKVIFQAYVIDKTFSEPIIYPSNVYEVKAFDPEVMPTQIVFPKTVVKKTYFKKNNYNKTFLKVFCILCVICQK